MLGSCVLLPVGYGLAGSATGCWGAAEVFVLGGATVVALVWLAQPSIWRLDQRGWRVTMPR
jgi:hypothetical protein